MGFSQAIKKVWEQQECVGRSILKQEGRFWERIIGKATVRTPRNDVDSRVQSNTVSVGRSFPIPAALYSVTKVTLMGNRVCSLVNSTIPLTQSPLSGVLG